MCLINAVFAIKFNLPNYVYFLGSIGIWPPELFSECKTNVKIARLDQNTGERSF